MLTELLAALAADTVEDTEAKLAAMSVPERLALNRSVNPAFRTIAGYVEHMELGFTPAAHHKLLLAELEAVERGENDRLMVLMPPGSAKSKYVSEIFPAWYLGRNPEKSILAASHTQDLIERFGRRARNLFADPRHRAVFGCGLATDRGAAAQWDTDKGGEYYAAGVGGAITGHRADCGIIDDPVRSREDADSDRSRERAWDWYINDYLTRLKPGAVQIHVQTRWHEDDLAGRILTMEGKRWRLLKLPMCAGINDPLGRQPGERLWPEWFTAEMMEDARRDVRVWNALYQQEPTGEDGDYFKRDWFQESAERPVNLAVYGASDYAVTEGGGDFTEHGIFGIDAWSNIYMLDWWRDQAAPDRWIEAQLDLIVKYKPLCWFGEAGTIRRSVEPFLMRRMEERRTFCRLEWLPSTADKAARCRSFQALASSGKVFVPPVANWKADVLGQLLRFPAGLHDDAVDTCSLIGRGLEHVNAPEMAQVISLPSHTNIGHARAKRYGR